MVFILVGVSFTSTIGVSHVTSDMKISPLFEIRRQRITDDETKAIEPDYIGMHNRLVIPLPPINDTSELLKRCILLLNRMDEKTFDTFVDVFRSHLTKNNMDEKYSEEELSIFLNQLKNKNKENTHPPTIYTCFMYEPFYCFGEWIRALLRFIILLPVYLIACLITTEPTIN